MRSPKSSLNRQFSHIYLERDAENYPLTKQVLSRFPKSRIIPIKHYKEIFNRPRQAWDLQKESMKLILAKRRDKFLYPCSEIAPSFGHHNFYYNQLMLNCLYDCEYCFLQGMFTSANVVAFMNIEDYLTSTSEEFRDKSAYICISYESDLLAFEDIFGYVRRWVQFAAANPNVSIEVRTKSANFGALADLEPMENVILAWTLSPQEVVERHEKGAASLTARCKAVCQAIERGWRVRACFDPLLKTDEWREIYVRFFDELPTKIPIGLLHDVSVGSFRMNGDFLNRMKRVRPATPILFEQLSKKGSTRVYSDELRSELEGLAIRALRGYLREDQINLLTM